MNIALLDDNQSVINVMKGAIEKEFESCRTIAEIHLFSKPSQLKNHLLEFDLFFLDINLPEVDGIQLAMEIRETNKNADIIFISSREERVFDTFKVQPYAFVRKSNFLQDIAEVIQRYCKEKKDNPVKRKILLPSQGSKINVDISDILYIEGNGVYQNVFLNKKEEEKILISSKMEELEAELYDEGFIRIHKGYPVNFQYIKSINTDMTLTLKNNKDLMISRRKLQMVKKRFLELCEKNSILAF